MGKRKDLTGQRFGSLMVLEFDEEKYNKDKLNQVSKIRLHWKCQCDLCGRIVSVRGENLVSGNTRGCGCDAHNKTANKNRKENIYEFDKILNCYVGYTYNTNQKFYVDIEDYPIVKKYCWYETSHHYLQSKVPNSKKKILLHRLVYFGLQNIDNDVIIDHINRRRFDCRRENLRQCTFNDNARNVSIGVNNSSGYVGVSFDKNSGKYRAYVTINGKYISLGYYHSINGAIEAREKGAKKYYKEFAPR